MKPSTDDTPPPSIRKSGSNLGAIFINDGDLDAARFWIRVFQLEEYVATAQADVAARPKIYRASVPIIADHTAGTLYWYYAILLFIDSLGLNGALGLVCYADEENRAKAEERRNEVADFIMKSMEERVKEGKMTGKMLMIEPTKEK